MRSALLLALAVGLGSSLHAQSPDLSGTWTFDADRSRPAESAVYAGIAAGGPPKTLHITQTASGQLVIESEMNEGHSRFYLPGAKSSTPAGQGGSVSMTTRWEGGVLVAEGRQDSPTGASASVRETITLGEGGRTLTVEITMGAGETAPATSTLSYRKSDAVPPCESWPTPCKRAPR